MTPPNCTPPIDLVLAEDVEGYDGYETGDTQPYNTEDSPGNTPLRPSVRRRLTYESEDDSDVEVLYHFHSQPPPEVPTEVDLSIQHRLSHQPFFYTQQQRRALMRQLRRHSLDREDSSEEPNGWAFITELDRLTVRRDTAAVGLDDYLFHRFYLPARATYERVCESIMPNRRMTRSMARNLGEGLFPVNENGHPRR